MRGTPEQRFYAKVRQGEGNYLVWAGATTPKGYGRFGVDGMRLGERADPFAEIQLF